MGRVRRYKKIKSIDPFAKRGSNNTKGLGTYDEPPDVFEEKQRDRKRKERVWDNLDDQEILLQREALRVLRIEKSLQPKKSESQIEGKKNDESMKDFKRRIREETTTTLRD